MTVDALISRLDGVRKTDNGRWQARCPAHDDRTPSLGIRDLGDGRILLHCFGGCLVEEVLSAIGLTFDDLYPPRRPTAVGYRPERRSWIPSDVFEIARREIGVVAIIACDMRAKKIVTEAGFARLFLAVQRLDDIAGAAYGK